MVKISIEVRNGTARLNVAVRARSIQEGFFVQDRAARAVLIEDEQPDLKAA